MFKSKVFVGVMWSGVQKFGTMAIQFISNIILARLLTPDDYGIVGMLLIFMSVASVFVDSGFGSALIQKKGASDEDYSTVFCLNLILSVIIYFILFFSAPAISHFYKTPILTNITRIESLIFVFNAFGMVQTARLSKKMDFKSISIVGVSSSLFSTIVAIAMAFYGMGLWSLVFKNIALAFSSSLLLWIIGRWRPSGLISKKSFKELFGFGGFMLLSRIVTTISSNIQTLLIGRMFNASDLGNYSQAKQLRDVPEGSISSIITQVLYPDFSNHQDDNAFLTARLNFGVYVISFIVVWAMLLLIVCAKPLIILLYSDKWVDAVEYFQILCVGGIPLSIQDINYYIIAAKGKSKALFIWNIVKVLIAMTLMLLGGKIWGIGGLLYAMVLATIIHYFVYACVACNFINVSVFPQLLNILRCVACGIIPFVSTLIVSLYCSGLTNILLLLIQVSVFSLLYIGVAFVFKMAPLSYLKGNVINLIKRN